MTVTTALVLAAAAPAAGGMGDLLSGPFGTLPLLAVMFGLMYFMILRPQQRRAKEHQQSIQAIKRGDTVILSSGIIGKVVRVEDKELGIEIAQNVSVKVVKAMVSEVRTRGEPAAANDAKS